MIPHSQCCSLFHAPRQWGKRSEKRSAKNRVRAGERELPAVFRLLAFSLLARFLRFLFAFFAPLNESLAQATILTILSQENHASQTSFITFPNIISFSNPHLCPNFGKSCFPDFIQKPYPIKGFLNPAVYFGQIPDPGSTLLNSIKKGQHNDHHEELMRGQLSEELLPSALHSRAVNSPG